MAYLEMVYLLKLVIFHGYVTNNQRVKAMLFGGNLPFQKQKTDDSHHL